MPKDFIPYSVIFPIH